MASRSRMESSEKPSRHYSRQRHSQRFAHTSHHDLANLNASETTSLHFPLEDSNTTVFEKFFSSHCNIGDCGPRTLHDHRSETRNDETRNQETRNMMVPDMSEYFSDKTTKTAKISILRRSRDSENDSTIFDDALSSDEEEDNKKNEVGESVSKNGELQSESREKSRVFDQGTQTDYVLVLTACESPPHMIHHGSRKPTIPPPPMMMAMPECPPRHRDRNRRMRNRPPRFQRLEEQRHRQKASKIVDDEFAPIEITDLFSLYDEGLLFGNSKTQNSDENAGDDDKETNEFVKTHNEKSQDSEFADFASKNVKIRELQDGENAAQSDILQDYYIWSRGENVKWGKCTERLRWNGNQWTVAPSENFYTPHINEVAPLVPEPSSNMKMHAAGHSESIIGSSSEVHEGYCYPDEGRSYSESALLDEPARAAPMLHVVPPMNDPLQDLPISATQTGATIQPSPDIIPVQALEYLLRGDVLSLSERQSILNKHHAAAIRLRRWGQATELRKLAKHLFGGEWVTKYLMRKTTEEDNVNTGII